MPDNMTPNPDNNSYSGRYIKEITLPSGNTYELVDAEARKIITSLNSYTDFLGVTQDSNITDGSTATSVIINNVSVTAATGNIVVKTTSSNTAGMLAEEFIYGGPSVGWQSFGDISAANLGKLAYKDSAKSGTTKYLTGITVTNTNTAAISVTASYQPAGTVTLTTGSSTLSLSTTSTTPSNTSNYWVYNPADNISITASAPTSNSADFLTGVTGNTLISSLGTTAPAQTAPSNGLSYAYVNEHNLQLYYITTSTLNAISATAATKAVTKINAPGINYNGTTRYVKPLTVTNITEATFTGTTATVTSSGAQKIASAASTSSVVTVS